MIEQTGLPDEKQQRALPAAFEPDLARSLTLPGRAPGWDLGPERRIDDGKTVKRVLAGVGVATLGLIGASALVRRTRLS